MDSLEQIRLALSNKNGTEPRWIKRSNLDLLREQHNRANKKAIRYQPNKEIGNIKKIEVVLSKYVIPKNIPKKKKTINLISRLN